MKLPRFNIVLDKKLDTENFIEFFDNDNPMIKEIFPQIKSKKDVLGAINYTYTNLMADLNNTVNFLNKNIPNLESIAKILSNKLDCSWVNIDGITIVPAVCPVCPRWIENNKFMVTYLFNKNAILRICAHEMSHFLYFKKLKELAQNQEIDTEYPSKDWLLSEIIAPILVNDEAIQKIVNNLDELFTPEPNMISSDRIESIIKIYRQEQSLLAFRDKALLLL